MAKPVKEVEFVMIVSATFAANLPANMKVYATMTIDPAIAALAQMQVPVNEAWVFEDLFVAASQTPDAILEMFRSLFESKFKSAPINGLIVTNPARPIPSKVVFAGADILTIVAQNLAAIGASTQTVTAYAKFRKFIG